MGAASRTSPRGIVACASAASSTASPSARMCAARPASCLPASVSASRREVPLMSRAPSRASILLTAFETVALESFSSAAAPAKERSSHDLGDGPAYTGSTGGRGLVLGQSAPWIEVRACAADCRSPIESLASSEWPKCLHSPLRRLRQRTVDDGCLRGWRERSRNPVLDGGRLRRRVHKDATTRSMGKASAMPGGSACNARGRSDDTRQRQHRCKKTSHDRFLLLSAAHADNLIVQHGTNLIAIARIGPPLRSSTRTVRMDSRNHALTPAILEKRIGGHVHKSRKRHRRKLHADSSPTAPVKS